MRGSNLKIERFKRRKLPAHQSKRMGSYVDNSFATTSYLLDEGRLRMSRRSYGRRLATSKHSTQRETYNDLMLRIEKVLTESMIQRW